MPQLFSRGSNTIARLAVFGAPFGLAGLVAVGLLLQRSPYVTAVGVNVEQPIPFSHRHHVGDDGIDCRYCHSTAEDSAFAGMPATATCMNCHQQIWSQSDTLEPLRRSLQTGQPIPWTRVTDLPDYVYFDHSVHVQKGIGCDTCHGRVDQMERVHKAESMQMTFCLDCHTHPEQHVRPREEVFNMSYQPPADQEEVGRRLVHAYGIQSQTSCSACHR
jgi:hypothetical protein